MSQALEVAQTLQLVCRRLSEAVHGQFCAISYYDVRESRLVLRASYGLYLDEMSNSLEGSAIAESIFQNQRQLNTPISSETSIGGVHFPASILKRCGSLLGLPLIANGRTIGVITIGRASKQAFPRNLVELCKVVSTPLASFLQNNDLSRGAAAAAASSSSSAASSAAGVVGGVAGVAGVAGADSAHAAVATPRGYQGTFYAGKPIVPGVSYGQCLMLASDEALLDVKIAKTRGLKSQFAKLRRAYESARKSLLRSSQEIGTVLAEADGGIFDMYITLLDDPTLRERIEDFIKEGYDLNSALALTHKAFQSEFQGIEDEYLRERILDVEDVLLRLLNEANNALPVAVTHDSDASLIIVAKELFPSQLVATPLKQVAGIVCESGGATSHAAILARALRIPMLVDIPKIQTLVTASDKLLMDSGSGLCFVNPSGDLLQQYQPTLEASQKHRRDGAGSEFVEADDLPETTDGTPVQLCGNITLFSEMAAMHAAGIREVGLYRTEFMFMIRSARPDENTQHRVLKRLLDDAKGAPVIIRALDIGGDKPLPYMKWEHELNPSLGWRGLRFLLSNPDFTQIHLRAILRACHSSNAQLMFPMVGDLCDLRRAKEAVERAAQSLTADRIPFGMPKIGMMLELPSAVVCLDQLLPEVDFVSIGTNDLVQYLFGVDRGNAKVTSWFQQCHPAVMRLLGQICDTVAKFPGKSLELCGELAGNAQATPLLLGAGLRKLSMSSAAIDGVRNCIRKVSLDDCRRLYEQACRCTSADEVQKLLR